MTREAGITIIFTIGHSRHEPEVFTALLKQHGIAAVYDVRSKPYSRFSPQFRRENLTRILQDEGIGYVFMGDQLGGKPRPGPALFAQGLDRLRCDAVDTCIAIMCAEKDPLNCHRCWTIAPRLSDLDIEHILADGSTQAHADLMRDQPPQQAVLDI